MSDDDRPKRRRSHYLRALPVSYCKSGLTWIEGCHSVELRMLEGRIRDCVLCVDLLLSSFRLSYKTNGQLQLYYLVACDEKFECRDCGHES